MSGARELYYLNKTHARKDADLHDPILDEGDHQTATAIGKAVMKRLGLSDAQINALMNPPEKTK